jgi:hypothetical protein
VTYAERVLAFVRQHPGLTDREIAGRLQGKGAAQQATNQACRQLERRGLLERRHRSDGLLGNYPRERSPVGALPSSPADTPSFRSPTADRAISSGPPLDLADEVVGVCRVQWLDAGEIGLFGDDVVMPRLGEHPGLYRFRFPQSRDSYVGETVNLRRRLYFYCKPGPTQATNLRMRERFRKARADGHSVLLGVSGHVELEIGGKTVGPDLGDKATRCLLENVAILAERFEGWHMLNL